MNKKFDLIERIKKWTPVKSETWSVFTSFEMSALNQVERKQLYFKLMQAVRAWNLRHFSRDKIKPVFSIHFETEKGILLTIF